jgi:hypothetical protein
LDSLAKSYRTFEKADFKNFDKQRKTIVWYNLFITRFYSPYSPTILVSRSFIRTTFSLSTPLRFNSQCYKWLQLFTVKFELFRRWWITLSRWNLTHAKLLFMFKKLPLFRQCFLFTFFTKLWYAWEYPSWLGSTWTFCPTW